MNNKNIAHGWIERYDHWLHSFCSITHDLHQLQLRTHLRAFWQLAEITVQAHEERLVQVSWFIRCLQDGQQLLLHRVDLSLAVTALFGIWHDRWHRLLLLHCRSAAVSQRWCLFCLIHHSLIDVDICSWSVTCSHTVYMPVQVKWQSVDK